MTQQDRETQTHFTVEQAARAEAVDRARAALTSHTIGGTGKANAAELITVAEWIVRGYDDVSELLDTSTFDTPVRAWVNATDADGGAPFDPNGGD